MKFTEVQEILTPLLQDQKNGDGMFILYFSQEEDKYVGFAGGLDGLDLGIVVKQFYERMRITVCDQVHPPQFITYGLLKDIHNNTKELMELIEESLSPEQYEKKSDPVIDGGGDIK